MPGTVYTVASGKGGVGKTTTSVNLAVALWREGNAVALVDADIGMANLAAVLDLEPEESLHDVLASRATVEDAVIEAKDGDLMVLPGDRSLDSFADADPNALRAVVDALADRADYVIVDTGAGLSYEDVLPLGMADGVVLVTTPDPAAFGDTTKTMEVADLLGAPIRGLVVTRAVADTDSEAIATEIGAELLGTIPEDPAVMASTVAGDPLESHAPDSDAAAAYRDLADGLLTGDEEWLAEHAREPAEPLEAGEVVDPTELEAVGAAAGPEETDATDDDAPGTDGPTGPPDGGDAEATASPTETTPDEDDDRAETTPGDGDGDSAEADPAEDAGSERGVAVDHGDSSEREGGFDPDDEPEPTGPADPDDETGLPPTEGEPELDESEEPVGDATAGDEESAEADETGEADAGDAETVHDEDERETESEEPVEPTDDVGDDDDEGDDEGDVMANDEGDVPGEDEVESEAERGGFFGWLGRLFS